jgi:prolipoprotein diacylglyceryltransferase
MHPILYQSESRIIESYSVFGLIALLVGGVVYYREFRRLQWDLEALLFVMGGCLTGAILGFSLIFEIFSANWSDIPQQTWPMDFTGKTFLGGLAGGCIGVEFTKKIIGYPHSISDAFAVAIPLGHAIGRFGCYLAGCCFGTETHLPWSVTYSAGTYPYLVQLMQRQITTGTATSLPVHPTQIYEMLFNLALFAFLMWKRDSFKVRGSLFKLYIVSYGIFRFLSEFIRGDYPFPAGGGLKSVQVLLLVAIFYFGWVFYRNELRKPTISEDGTNS